VTKLENSSLEQLFQL